MRQLVIGGENRPAVGDGDERARLGAGGVTEDTDAAESDEAQAE
jgi:hypothetical protein